MSTLPVPHSLRNLSLFFSFIFCKFEYYKVKHTVKLMFVTVHYVFLFNFCFQGLDHCCFWKPVWPVSDIWNLTYKCYYIYMKWLRLFRFSFIRHDNYFCSFSWYKRFSCLKYLFLASAKLLLHSPTNCKTSNKSLYVVK